MMSIGALENTLWLLMAAYVPALYCHRQAHDTKKNIWVILYCIFTIPTVYALLKLMWFTLMLLGSV